MARPEGYKEPEVTRAGRALGFAWTNLMMAQFALEDATTETEREAATTKYELAQVRYENAEQRLQTAMAAKEAAK